MIGLPSINGYPLPMEQRFEILRRAGFEALLLWWGPDEAESRAERVRSARNQHMHIENVHAATEDMNALWHPGSRGDAVLAELLQETEDCGRWGIQTMVVHLTNGKTPPPLTGEGMKRLERLILRAESCRVRLAFENLRTPLHTAHVLDSFDSPFAGLCYDSGHHRLWTPEYPWLETYARRVFAIHLQDTPGTWDAHMIPFEGIVDWDKLCAQLGKTAYSGAVTLEANHRPDKTGDPDYGSFLRQALEAGKRLETMLNIPNGGINGRMQI